MVTLLDSAKLLTDLLLVLLEILCCHEFFIVTIVVIIAVFVARERQTLVLRIIVFLFIGLTLLVQLVLFLGLIQFFHYVLNVLLNFAHIA